MIQLRVRIYVINKDTPSQYYGLKSVEDNRPLYAAKDKQWKTYGGAYNWATRHGYQVLRGIDGEAPKQEIKPVKSAPSPVKTPYFPPVTYERKVDLRSYLHSEIYALMDEREKKYWNIFSASALCTDLACQGIVANERQVFEIIRDFIQQDKKKKP